MAARRLLSLVGCLLLTALPGHQCFQWQSNPADGATFNVIAGDDVTIPWMYTVNTGDVISVVNWFFRGSSEEIVAMFSHSMFMALPAFSGRVQQANNGGLTLKNVTFGDSGTYSVEVTGQDANGQAFTQRRSVDIHVTIRPTPFLWQNNTAEGQTISAMESSDVTMPWTYTTEAGVVISGVMWLFKSGSEAIMAESIHGQFVVLPSYMGRLQQATNGGITLKHVTVSDSGTYIVEVTGHFANGTAFTQRRSLVLHVPVNGQWGSWGSYGSCSKTCGDGTQRRTRTCNNPAPVYGGAACVGSFFETATCNLQECPVNGQWGSWGGYGLCMSCEHRIKARTRDCNNPAPDYGGAGCAGIFFDTAPCDLPECLYHGDPSPKATFHDTHHLLWKDCGDNNAWLHVTSFDITPGPLHIPGNGTITIHAQNGNTAFDHNVALVVEIRKHLLGLWSHVPCTGPTTPTDQRLGSCTYNDICDALRITLLPGFNCPAIFKQQDLPCTCPFTIPAHKTINVNNEPLTFAAPRADLIWLTTGEYYIKFAMYETGQAIARMCFEAYVNLNPR